MITLPDIERLHDLGAFPEPLCVTIYIPFIDTSTMDSPMRIVLKDAIKDAAVELESLGASERVIKRTLRPARRLAGSTSAFRSHYREGLALFLHASRSWCYYLPADAVVMRVRVGRGFDTEQLRRVVDSNRAFAVLVLDSHATQLYVGDRFRLEPAPLEGFPADMVQTLRIDEFPSSRELHGIAPAYMGKGSEGYHGQYNVAEVNKQQLTEFFRIVDRRLHKYLAVRHLPLVLAGVGYLLPLYRAVNTYKAIVPGGLRGSFRRIGLSSLHARAWNALLAA